jgi:hypothetical protein
MIIKNPPRLTNRQGWLKFLETDLWTWLKELTILVTKINFNENFQSFRVDNLEIRAGQQVAIPNGLKNRYAGVIPTGRLIVRQKGDAVILDGTTEWTADLVYLMNPSLNDVIISVIFFL